MLRPRIIPCLLVQNRGLVKTIHFANPKYVGDPINAVRIFNEKAVDELIVIDIDASTKGKSPDYRMIEHLAEECRMPLCYGGGITTAEQVQSIVGLGVEKVAMSSAACETPQLVAEAADRVGSQSVVVVLDIKRRHFINRYEVRTHNATRKTGRCPFELSRLMEKYGAGEIVINSIDNDGLMKGYDLALMRRVKKAVGIPVTALGGAGSLQDISTLFRECEVSGAAAGSLFVFKGNFRAVLINYPSQEDKDMLIACRAECVID